MDDALEPVTGTVERVPRDVAPAVAVAPAPAPSAGQSTPPADDGTMSLVDHLGELRHRLFISIIAVVIGGVIGFYFAPAVQTILAEPLRKPGETGPVVQFLTVSGGFFLYMKVSFVFGLLIGLPVIIYELWAFVSPGLTPHERRTALPWIPMAIVFFAIGTVVAYVTLPYAVAFLTSFTVEGVSEVQPSGEAYYGFVTTLFLIFGAVMEFPIVLVLLHKLGILSIEMLTRSRRMVILGIVIFAVVATPGGDPVSPIVMSVVMYALYEFTIFMLKRSERRRPVPPNPTPEDVG